MGPLRFQGRPGESGFSSGHVEGAFLFFLPVCLLLIILWKWFIIYVSELKF